MKTFKLYTLGCKVNQYDSQKIREQFLSRGFSEISDGKQAEIYIINTCTVTSRADAKGFDLIRRSLKENSRGKVLVAGCLARSGDLKIKKTFGKRVEVAGNLKLIESSKGISDFKGHSRAFIKIQDGCDNRCAFCKVSLVRGISQSRNFTAVINEAKVLIKKGFKELVLCGICLGSFGRDLKLPLKLSDIIFGLIGLKGDFRLRLSSIEAKDVTEDIIKIMAGSNKLCCHLHIPFQSGDDTVLKRMARLYKAEDYFDTVCRVRQKNPLAAITTDIMVGFPGESETNFKKTLKFLERINPSRIHCFPFSPRPGTPAFKFTPRISCGEVNKRMKVLLGLAGKMSRGYQKKFIGKELEVLVEVKKDKLTGFCRGYSEHYIYTLIEARDLTPGQIIKVRATSLNSHYLVAQALNQP